MLVNILTKVTMVSKVNHGTYGMQGKHDNHGNKVNCGIQWNRRNRVMTSSRRIVGYDILEDHSLISQLRTHVTLGKLMVGN
jgi:hypothetical protein